MPDQATELRKLVLKSTRQTVATAGPAPRVVGIAGARQGVGVTTVTLQMALTLSQQGTRIVVVDADWRHSDLTARCLAAARHRFSPERGDETSFPEPHVIDVLESRRDVHEVLTRGPAGLQLVPGANRQLDQRLASEQGQLRLMKQLGLLGRYTDAVLLDAGDGFNNVCRTLCRAVDDLLLITTPDAECIMDTYAAIKVMPKPLPKLNLVVNRAVSPEQAAEVAHRIHESCERFLEVPLVALGGLPLVDLAADPQRRGFDDPEAAFPLALQAIARKLKLWDVSS